MKQIPSYRESLLSGCRREALDALYETRVPPGWTRESYFYGRACETCGKVRPSQPGIGCYCDCDRAERDRIANDLVKERWAETAELQWDDAGVPARYRECRFENFDARDGTAEALKITREWSENFDFGTDSGLFLAGTFGSGKSHLAVSALYRVIERRMPTALFTTSGALVAHVRAGERIDMTPVEIAVGVELLVLDDVGQEIGSDFTRDIISSLVFRRYESARPTVFTSNQGPTGLANALGGGVVSRIHEMTQPIALSAEDYRRRAR